MKKMTLACKPLSAGLQAAMITMPERPSGEEIKNFREAVCMSQAQFARQFNLPLGTLRRWEQEKNEPRGNSPFHVALRRILRIGVSDCTKRTNGRSNEKHGANGRHRKGDPGDNLDSSAPRAARQPDAKGGQNSESKGVPGRALHYSLRTSGAAFSPRHTST